MIRLRATASLVLLAGALALGGCVSLFPKQTPAQLYRFSAEPGRPAAAGQGGDGGARVAVILPPVTLTRAASGDQLLAMTGDEAAFIAGARWVAPAAVLWEEDVRGAFATHARRVRLLTRTEVGTGQAFLRLTAPVFEVRYAAAGAAPTVHVRLNALMLHRSGAFAAERTFDADVPASDNRISAIVTAYDQAVAQVVGPLIAWTDANADAAAVDEPSPAMAAAGVSRPVVSTRTTTTSTHSAAETSVTSTSPRR